MAEAVRIDDLEYHDGSSKLKGEFGLVVTASSEDSDELLEILMDHLPEFLELFIRKNSEYGENAQTLGAKGQFADIWRKIGKLKTGLWDDKEHLLTSESVDEILLDLIGHCFLTLRMRGRAVTEKAEETLRLREAKRPQIADDDPDDLFD